jgi:flagellar biosynthetic protein FliP
MSLPTRTTFARAGQRALPMLAAAAVLGLAFFPAGVVAQATLPALTATPGADGSQTYSLSMQTMLLMTSLSFLPAALLMMTGFTRIIIVLGLLRSAMGTAMSPPNHVLIGLALFLTFYTMSPVFDKIYTDAYKPLSEGTIQFEAAVERAAGPLRTFMLHQTRENDLSLFANLAKQPALEDPSQVPMRILVPAFITSELKTAFQIGFTIFIPFLIIDLVVASVLMALGMMMVPPVTVALPFKLMLFVLADGWNLLLGSLAAPEVRGRLLRSGRAPRRPHPSIN